jgi:hypothetical protein
MYIDKCQYPTTVTLATDGDETEDNGTLWLGLFEPEITDDLLQVTASAFKLFVSTERYQNDTSDGFRSLPLSLRRFLACLVLLCFLRRHWGFRVGEESELLPTSSKSMFILRRHWNFSSVVVLELIQSTILTLDQLNIRN